MKRTLPLSILGEPCGKCFLEGEEDTLGFAVKKIFLCPMHEDIARPKFEGFSMGHKMKEADLKPAVGW